MKCPTDKIIWEQGMCRELGRLSNGYDNIAGTQTIRFIPKARVPKYSKITYMRIVCTYKQKKNRINTECDYVWEATGLYTMVLYEPQQRNYPRLKCT